MDIPTLGVCSPRTLPTNFTLKFRTVKRKTALIRRVHYRNV